MVWPSTRANMAVSKHGPRGWLTGKTDCLSLRIGDLVGQGQMAVYPPTLQRAGPLGGSLPQCSWWVSALAFPGQWTPRSGLVLSPSRCPPSSGRGLSLSSPVEYTGSLLILSHTLANDWLLPLHPRESDDVRGQLTHGFPSGPSAGPGMLPSVPAIQAVPPESMNCKIHQAERWVGVTTCNPST